MKKNSQWMKRHRNHIIIFLTGCAAVLAVVGSFQYYMSPLYSGKIVYERMWSTILYSVLKLFAFSPTVSIGSSTPLCYEIAKWLAPLCTGYWLFCALEIVLRHRLEQMARKFTRRSQIAVFGYNAESAAFLRSLEDENRKSRAARNIVSQIALISEKPLEQEIQLQLERRHILVSQSALLDGSPSPQDDAFIRHCLSRFQEIVLFYEDATLNFTILKKFIDYLKRNPDLKAEPALLCAIRCEDKVLKKLITDYYDDSQGHSFLELSIFNMPEIAASDLFRQVPLWQNCLARVRERIGGKDLSPEQIMEQIPNPHLLIAGFGRFGQAVFEEALMSGTLSCCSRIKGYEMLRITIIDRDCGRCQDLIESRYPRIDRLCRISYINSDFSSIQVERRLRALPPVTYVAICFSSQTSGIAAMDKLCRYLTTADVPVLPGSREAGIVPVAVRMNTDAAVLRYRAECSAHGLTERCRLQSFGTAQDILTRQNVLRHQLEEDAKDFHAAYMTVQNALFSEAEPTGRDELWHQLNFEKKESNRAQVKNRPYMRELFSLLPPLPPKEEVLANGNDPNQVLRLLEQYPLLDILAAQEHRRWCSFHYASGYAGYHPDKAEKGRFHLLEDDGEYYGKVHYCLIDSWDQMKADPQARETIIYDLCGIYGYREAGGLESAAPAG